MTRTSSIMKRIFNERTCVPKHSIPKYTRKIERAQDQRTNEVSMQKKRENHETFSSSFPNCSRMQKEMNSKNDIGDFQDVESNYKGRLSHVSSQLVMIPSSRTFLSHDKDFCLTHGINLNYRTTFLHVKFFFFNKSLFSKNSF